MPPPPADSGWNTVPCLGPPESPDDDGIAGLVAVLLEEMTAAWKRGDRPRAEDFLARHPELREHPEASIRLIYEEVCLRQERGEQVAPDEVIGRFPQWRAELEVLLACHQVMKPSAAADAFPAVGETLGDYHLLALLGRGAHGRVFLARQPALADRPVVLKVSTLDGEEHLSLARLQQTHIVPLYAVQDFPERNLRALCMPYLGGVTLDRLLAALAGRPPVQRSGQQLVDAFDALRGRAPAAAPPRPGPARRFLSRASYVQAVCWVGACLAEALQYAHERGLVHLDLKPSNVLIADDGQPMLLDFHLAREPLRPDGPAPERVGGTPLYASPEQRAAAGAVRAGRPVPAAVDGRSDIYSLGLVLCEMLGAAPREGPTAPSPLAALPPCVSVGLADVLRKCLAPDPRDRYADAAALADDLRRHLADQPLRGVANRSLRERWRKWRRRRPQALVRAGACLAALVAVLALALVPLTYTHQRLDRARAALADGQEQIEAGQYSSAAGTLTRGLSLAQGWPGGADLSRALGEQLGRARRLERAHRLHELADRLRFVYGIDSLSPRTMRGLEAACRAVWEERDRLRGPEAELEPGVRADLLDLAVLGADLRVRLAKGDEVGRARREALGLLAEAEALCGPGPVLARERQAYAEALGLTDLAREAAAEARRLAPRTAWEHYAVGRSLLRSGDLVAADAAFDQALRQRPQSFWANFSRGACAHRLGRHRDALVAFSVCVALEPACPPCYCNRALAHDALGEADRALLDYDHALRLDPSLAPALLNRGMLHHRAGRHEQALADLRRAREQGADAALVDYQLALVHLARHDRAAARGSLQSALRHRAEYKEARELLERLGRGQ